jgi:hypothetical protein
MALQSSLPVITTVAALRPAVPAFKVTVMQEEVPAGIFNGKESIPPILNNAASSTARVMVENG